MSDPVPCPTCGPQEPPTIHTLCHPTINRRTGCGHPLKDHAPGLKCRVCKVECGIDCRPQITRRYPFE